MSTISTRRRRGVVAVAALAAACLTAGLVPGQAFADTRDFIEYPAPPPLDDMREMPSVATLTKDASDTFAYAMAVVAANRDGVYREGTVEADLAAALAVAPADTQKRAEAASAELLKSPEAVAREFGKAGRLSPKEFTALGFDGTIDRIGADRAGLATDIRAVATRIEREFRAEEAAHQEYLKINHIPIGTFLPRVTDLTLRLEKVKCVEETDWNAFGSDEIAMGAIKVDNEGETVKVSPFDVPESGGFDNGDVFTYTAPGKSYGHFTIKPGPFPRKYVMTMLMAEIDNGGFAATLHAAWAKVKDKVQKIIADAVEGLTSPYIGPALAEALGQVVAWLVTTFVGWIINLFQDDLFKPVTVSVKLPSVWAYRYDNGVTSGWDNWRTGTHTSTFYQDTGDTSVDGIYKANVHWELKTT